MALAGTGIPDGTVDTTGQTLQFETDIVLVLELLADNWILILVEALVEAIVVDKIARAVVIVGVSVVVFVEISAIDQWVEKLKQIKY